MDDFLWTKGEDLALVWPGGIVMLPSDVPHEAATSVWQVARDGADLGAILQHLTDVLGVSLLAMPMFAIVLVSDDRARVAVRGDWGVEMDAADGRHLVRGSGITTWSEQSFEDVVDITLGRDLTTEGAELPIVSGVVRVARVTTRPRRGVLEEQRLSDDPEGDAVDAGQLLVEPAASLDEVVEDSWASPSDDPVPDVPLEEQLNLEAAPLEDESVPEGDKEPAGELDDSLDHEGEQADPSDADADADLYVGKQVILTPITSNDLNRRLGLRLLSPSRCPTPTSLPPCRAASVSLARTRWRLGWPTSEWTNSLTMMGPRWWTSGCPRG